MPTTLQCACGKTVELSGTEKPRKWHVEDGEDICSECFKNRFETKAITLSVAEIYSPSKPSVRIKGDELDEFFKLLHSHFRLATVAANGLLEECRRVDVYPTEETMNGAISEFKIPLRPDNKSWAYQMVRSICPSLNTGSAAHISRTVVAKYRSQRNVGRWLYRQNALSFKYPYPLVIRSQELKLRMEERTILNKKGKPKLDKITKQPVIYTVMLASIPIGDQRYEFRLRKEPKYDPNFEAFQRIVTGEYSKGTAELYWRKLKVLAKEDEPDAVVKNSRDAAKNKKSWKLQLKIVFTRERKKRKAGDKTIVLKTDKNSFWIALVEETVLWRLNEDRIRGHIAQRKKILERINDYKVFQQRQADDRKYRRRNGKGRNKMLAYLATKAANSQNWLKNWKYNVIADFVTFAKMNGCTLVHYDDSDRSYLRHTFAWSDLKNQLSRKLKNEGIGFFDAAPNETDTESTEIDEEDESTEDRVQRPRKGSSKVKNGENAQEPPGATERGHGSKQPGLERECINA